MNQNQLDAQRALEAESRALGSARYRKQRTDPWIDMLGPVADEASLPPGRQLLRRLLKPTSDAIEAFLDEGASGKAGRKHVAFNLLDGAEAAPLAYLTLRCGIQAGVRQERIQKATAMIARAVKDHLQSQSFAEANPRGAAGLQRSLAGRKSISAKRQKASRAIYAAEGVELNWSLKDDLLVGSKLLELATAATGLFDLDLVSTRQGKNFTKQQRVRLTQVADDWLENQHQRCELLDPVPMPMIVEPVPWTNLRDGGYLTPLIGNLMVRSRSRPYLDEMEHVEMGSVFAAVNAVQGTRWQINRQLLDVMDEAWANGDMLGGFPGRDAEPLPAKPSDYDMSEEARLQWKRAASEVHARNAGSKGKRAMLAQKLWVSRKFADQDAIYFPHSLDFRGRVYPIPQGGPHPQDSDPGRALLRFADGKSLGLNGARWLAIHLANQFGLGKASFEERINWVKANRDAIVDSAMDPMGGQRFWSSAEKPWTALAACFEWSGYETAGPGFVSHLPIAIDGSNSGLQHLTALLRDPDAAPHVNLTSSPIPQDIYELIAAKAQALIDTSDDPRAAPWKNGKITRKIVKGPCMTYAYSVTQRGMADQIYRQLQQMDVEAQERRGGLHLSGADNFASSVWLGGILFRIIESTVPAARSAMRWLKDVGKVLNLADQPLWWTTPVGLPIQQRNPKVSRKTVEVTWRGRAMKLSLDDERSEFSFANWLEDDSEKLNDAAKMLSGISPNFIHSLDASHLMLTVLAAKQEGITDIAVIHDSFGTHAADTDVLSKVLRQTFVNMYQQDPLQQFRSEVVQQLRHRPELADKIPPLPKYGTFNLELVMAATYMFA